MKIYCCGCETEVKAHLSKGDYVYPHRPDLFELPFWVCPDCDNYVGCHYKTSTPTKPLGVIPTPAIRNIRKKVHALIDPIWQSKQLTRKQVYSEMSKRLGKSFHSAKIRTDQEAAHALAVANALAGEYKL
jgi:hypothetical protein